MNTFMNALLPQIQVVRNARKISFWVPAEEVSETGMTYLQEVEHDLKIFQKRLDKAMATGVCGQRLELIRRQRDYKRKVFLKLRKATK
jgi:hypothetical protein